MPYKRSDWNTLLAEVNAVLENPPSGCDPIEPIPDVQPMHRWGKSDIRTVHEKLIETCADISFDTIPNLWKQSIPDEIREKLGEAWCDCDDCPLENGFTSDGTTLAEHGTTLSLFSFPPRLWSACFGDDWEEFDNICQNNSVPLSSIISGLQIGSHGLLGRQWRLQRQNNFTTVPIGVMSGGVSCEGTVLFDGPQQFCKTGFNAWRCAADADENHCATNPFCIKSLEDGAELVQAVGTTHWTLQLDCSGVIVCWDCDGDVATSL